MGGHAQAPGLQASEGNLAWLLPRPWQGSPGGCFHVAHFPGLLVYKNQRAKAGVQVLTLSY